MIVIANWKMNPLTLKKAEKLLDLYSQLSLRNLWIAPPNIFLNFLINKYRGKFIFGSQNCFYQEKGGYTGEISFKMLEKIGAQFVILNHSERRKLGETLELNNKKIQAVLNSRLKAVVCFGEDQKILQRKNLIKTWNQLASLLFKGIDIKNRKLYLIYEPSWAISTQKEGPAPKEIVQEFINWAKNRGFAKILYGGSVFATTIEDYLDLKLDGFLVGSQSLDFKKFKIIIKKIKNRI